MSQRNIDNAEAERWKKKFLDALEDQEKRERNFNNRLKLLRRGLVGVSLAGDGLDAELDRELTSLRTSLRADGSESGFEVLFERIEKSVLRLDSRKEQSSEALQNSLSVSVTQLQSLDLPRDNKREIRKFAKSLPSRIQDAQNHAQIIVEYLQLLKVVVSELSLRAQTQGKAPKPGFWQSMFTAGKSEAPHQETVAHQETAAPVSQSSAPTEAATRSQPIAIEPQADGHHADLEDVSAATAVSNDAGAELAAAPADRTDSAQLHSLDTLESTDDKIVAVPAETRAQVPGEIPQKQEQEQESEPGFSAIANHAEPALLRILENIYISEQSLALANKVREKVANGLNWYEFVVVLEDISAVITTSLGQERSEFQEFLNELNESLEQVQEYVQRSRESDAQARESDNELDAQMRSQVADIAESVRSADNIQELKTSVQGQLETILHAMDTFKEVKQEHHQSVDARAQELEARIKVMEQESDELKANLAQQAQQAMSDALTGLPNRAAYDNWIKTELAVVNSAQPSSTVFVICDVDHFKKINDNYGHLAGDKVLKILAKAISGRIRENDFLARYGGEEFVLLMPNTTLEAAIDLVEPIREAVADCPFHFKEQQVQITMSFGLALYDQVHSPESIFEKADKALYLAKANGRNRICTEAEIVDPPSPSTK